jgi:secreted trypsin-like serine protease
LKTGRNRLTNQSRRTAALSAFLGILLSFGSAVVPAIADTGKISGGKASETAPISFAPRIVGGNTVSITDAPWQVAIIDKSRSSNYQGQFCGGSLISAEWIATAAHCVVSGSSVLQARSIGIQVGNANLSTSSLSALSVSTIRVHPSYGSSGENHDIALIKLSSPVALSSSVAPIAINRSAVVHETSALVTGWGQTGRTDDSQVVVGPYNFPTALQGATVYVSDDNCWGQAPSGFNSTTMLCGGTPSGIPAWQKDTCQGDSGGPLAITVSGTSYLAGITSWGFGCAWDSPGVYTKVSNYASWIDLYVPAPPANFTLSPNPTVTGLAVVGQTLSASTGEWNPSPSFAYQWFAGSNAISRATRATYVVSRSDANKTISVRVTATRNGYLATSRSSDPTALVAASLPFTSTGTPTVSGSLVVGETLTANTGIWAPAPSFSYQWLANGATINRATGATYVLTSSDIGKTIAVRVTATRNGYTTTSATTTETELVTAGLSFTSSPNPTISGSPVVGQTLTANAGSWSPTPSFRYQWLSNGRAISGATSASWVVTRAYRGRSITVQVTGSLSGYAMTTKTSGSVSIPR